MSQKDPLTEKVIGAAIEVHRNLGPGLLESAYEECLCYELTQTGLFFERQKAVPVRYKSVRIDASYRADLVVEQRLLVELKAVERILPIHQAQVLTYLKLSGVRTGLLLNFNTKVLKDGIKLFVI